MIKKLSVMILAILVSHLSAFSLTEGIQSNASASQVSNPKDEVKLVVSGDGLTEEQAIKTALRSAIEQAYGTFVSANTAILNDALVKDEIVTISTGNIKSYKKIASARLPNGKTTVTLDAVVCISKLTNYAQSKGASTEFAGASFGMNMKIKELNKKNELKALNNLIEQIRLMLPTAFDMKLYVDDPALPEGGGRGFLDKLDSRLLCLRYYDIRTTEYDNFTTTKYLLCYDKVENSKLVNKLKAVPNNNYIINFNVLYEKNQNTFPFFSFIAKNLASLGLSDDEVTEYKKTNIPVLELDFHFPFDLQEMGINRFNSSENIIYYSRASKKEISNLFHKLSIMFSDCFSNFQIVDNLGVKSSFNAKALYQYAYVSDLQKAYEDNDTNKVKVETNPYIKYNKRTQNNIATINRDSLDYDKSDQARRHFHVIIDNTPLYRTYDNRRVFARGEGLFDPVVLVNYDTHNCYDDCPPGCYRYGLGFEFGSLIPSDWLTELQGGNRNSVFLRWKISCLIPQDKISQYSNFKLVPKH